MRIIDSTQEIKDSYLKSKGAKRHRIKLTVPQLNALEQAYQSNNYLSNERKDYLINIYNIPERNIIIWFQNRRAKDKRNQ
ncbi:hypothetical protein H312_02242 [Anncaliia algerae PRA339]|uniref:Homeobox domain-containing protein n=1 Tax=Anncaliia algerae PRA339 TaxID=1288291 RepID=A0A059F052_9MICR|nr:hypothetical protein H312_02242 [Anncaliia algerae PRA339]